MCLCVDHYNLRSKLIAKGERRQEEGRCSARQGEWVWFVLCKALQQESDQNCDLSECKLKIQTDFN